MKNLSLALNGVLLVAVAILYYLHFKGNSSEENAGDSMVLKSLPVTSQGIVYINSDSLLDEYQFYKDERDKLEAAQTNAKNQLKEVSDKLQRDAATYQEQAIGMTNQERAAKEEELGRRQQKLMQQKDELAMGLDDAQGKSSEELYNRLNNFLRKFNKGKNFQFVLGYQKGGGILYANDSLNITRQVIEGLNAEYKEEKAK
jgi:outer membrane protein